LKGLNIREKEMAEVSVIIPTYNCGQYITEAIESVLSQTYKDVEIIVVDDGSKDGTYEKIERWVKSNRIRYLYQLNQGVAAARNYGINNSSGRYLAFLDADDKWLPEMLARCLGVIEEDRCDLVSTDNYIVYLQGGKEIKREIQSYEWIEKSSERLFLTFLEVGGIGSPEKVVFKREIFDKVGLFDASLPVYEDLDLWIRIAKYGFTWGHIREALVIYHKGVEGSLFSRSPQYNQDCRLKILKKYKRETIKNYPYFKEIYAELLWNFGRSYALDYKAYGKALNCFLDSLRTYLNIRRAAKSAYSLLKSLIHTGIRSDNLA